MSILNFTAVKYCLQVQWNYSTSKVTIHHAHAPTYRSLLKQKTSHRIVWTSIQAIFHSLDRLSDFKLGMRRNQSGWGLARRHRAASSCYLLQLSHFLLIYIKINIVSSNEMPTKCSRRVRLALRRYMAVGGKHWWDEWSRKQVPRNDVYWLIDWLIDV